MPLIDPCERDLGTPLPSPVAHIIFTIIFFTALIALAVIL